MSLAISHKCICVYFNFYLFQNISFIISYVTQKIFRSIFLNFHTFEVFKYCSIIDFQFSRLVVKDTQIKCSHSKKPFIYIYMYIYIYIYTHTHTLTHTYIYTQKNTLNMNFYRVFNLLTKIYFINLGTLNKRWISEYSQH